MSCRVSQIHWQSIHGDPSRCRFDVRPHIRWTAFFSMHALKLMLWKDCIHSFHLVIIYLIKQQFIVILPWKKIFTALEWQLQQYYPSLLLFFNIENKISFRRAHSFLTAVFFFKAHQTTKPINFDGQVLETKPWLLNDLFSLGWDFVCNPRSAKLETRTVSRGKLSHMWLQYFLHGSISPGQLVYMYTGIKYF